MIGVIVEVDAENYIRPKRKEQAFQIALEILTGVSGGLP